MRIRTAEPADYGELYTLQLAAFLDEAKIYDTEDVPSLNYTFDEYKERLSTSDTWVAVENTRIVGAVSLRSYRGIPDVERLAVAPDRRGEGISSKLLKVLELAAIDAGHTSIQLIVGDLAVNNQRIYEHLGWQRTGSFNSEEYEHVVLHNMTKTLVVPATSGQ